MTASLSKRRRRLPPVAWLLLAGVLCGCSTAGPDFVPPRVDAPEQWADRHGGSAALAAPSSAGAARPSGRWAAFGDAELLRLQAQALQANADVRTATLHLLQARATQATVSAQRGVQVATKAGVARQRQSETGSASRLVNTIGGPNTPQLLQALSAPFTLYQAGFDASWEPDLWGRVLRSEEAAQAGTDADRAVLRQVQLGLRAELARAYFTLRNAQRQEQLVQHERALAQQAETLLDAQVRHGLSDESPRLRQRAQVAGLAALLPALQAQQAQAMNQITLLCGAEPGSLNTPLAPAAAPAEAAALPDLQLGLPADLARRRPDVAAAEARLHAATAGIGIAVADLYPRFTLGASFGLESVGAARFTDWGSRQWSVGPSLSLPLWDRGRRRATITLRELQQQEAAVAFQQTVLKAWHEVDDAVSAYVAETRRQVQLAGRAQDAAVDARLAQARQASGLTSGLPVLVARSTEIEARRELRDSRARQQTLLAALYKALGDDDAAAPLGAPR